MKRDLTIGEVAERAGVTVKTLRFYSDAGLLPPAGRSESNYRLYTLGDVVRVGLIRSLREAGLSVRDIRAVLGRDLPLADALRLRLAAVEAQMKALGQVASALRLALRSDPSEDDVRRLLHVTKLSNAERRAAIEQFYARVAEGIAMVPDWQRRMIEASAPDLPENPSSEQLEAWIELHGIITDPSFIEAMRANAREVWTEDFDHSGYHDAWNTVVGQARAAMDRRLAPSSAEAGAIIRDFMTASAAAMKRAPDAAFIQWWHDKAKRHDQRAARYWELVAVLGGSAMTANRAEEWAWIIEAARLHLRAG